MKEHYQFIIMILKTAKLTLSPEMFLETMQLKVLQNLENLVVTSLLKKQILERLQLKWLKLILTKKEKKLWTI